MSDTSGNSGVDGAPGNTSGISSISEYRAHDSSAMSSSCYTSGDEQTTWEGALAANVSEIGYDNPELEATLAKHGLDRAAPGQGPSCPVIHEERAVEGPQEGGDQVLPVGQTAPDASAASSGSPSVGAPVDTPKGTDADGVAAKVQKGKTPVSGSLPARDVDASSEKSRSSCGSAVKNRREQMQAASADRKAASVIPKAAGSPRPNGVVALPHSAPVVPGLPGRNPAEGQQPPFRIDARTGASGSCYTGGIGARKATPGGRISSQGGREEALREQRCHRLS